MPAKLHQRRPSPAPAFRTPTPAHTPNPNPPTPAHTPNPPTVGGPCNRGTREQGGGLPGGSGPKTPAGKAVSARNATTHGLFCRQTVLPHLGEDPQAYRTLLLTLYQQFDPRTVVERQYLELWADASWKLRRLSRFEAQVWENDQLDEDARLLKLERVLRLQASVRRQLDKALAMLSKLVPETQERYARRAVLAGKHLTESDCRADPSLAYSVEFDTQADILAGADTSDLDQSTLDNAQTALDYGDNGKNGQNEPPPNPPTVGEASRQAERGPRRPCSQSLDSGYSGKAGSGEAGFQVPAQDPCHWPFSPSEGGKVPNEGG